MNFSGKQESKPLVLYKLNGDTLNDSLSRNEKINWKPSRGGSQEDEML